MEDYATDEERVEALKKWWKENGKSLLAGVVLGLSVLFGWQAWVAGKNSEADSASNAYASMMASVERDQVEDAQKLAAEIVGQFSSSPYAILSAMAVARLKVEQKDLLGAKTQLQWALDHAVQEEMQQLIRLRLARVLFALGESDAALATLSGVDAGEFLATYEELMGDIYLQQGNSKQAYESYRSSLSRMDLNSQNRMLLQLKLDDMAGMELGMEQGQEERS